ncbi:MAG TPA: AAA family ATPase, partial [Alphaproteobacteria bacterium]|nr:AAA family ATPase [Alphaproteobacteria bacterium]
MSLSDQDHQFLHMLARIADALEARHPPDPDPANLPMADAYVWNKAKRRLSPVDSINRVELRLLCGIDQQRDMLLSNTIAFV